MSNWPITTTDPTARNTTIAPTFAIAAQNSNSPNARADSKLITNTTSANGIGAPGNSSASTMSKSPASTASRARCAVRCVMSRTSGPPRRARRAALLPP